MQTARMLSKPWGYRSSPAGYPISYPTNRASAQNLNNEPLRESWRRFLEGHLPLPRLLELDGSPSPAYGTMYGMKRTTVYLPDELKAALERTAAAQGTTEAQVVRTALESVTEAQVYPAPRLPLFESGDPTLAERVDEELAAGFGA